MTIHLSNKLRTNPKLKLPPGTNRCLCASCGHYFGGVTAFDMHRVGPASERACLAPGGVSDGHNRPLLKLNKYGYWVRIDIPIHSHKPAVRKAA